METNAKEEVTIAFTGHRPSKLPNGWEGPHTEVLLFLTKKLVNYEKRIVHGIQGGALGWDQIAGQAMVYAGIYQTLAEPFPGFWKKWRIHQIEDYMEFKYGQLQEDYDEVVQVNPDEDYAAWKLHARNEYMVNRCDEVWAWWDGTRKGGTYACLQYAHKKGIPIVNLYKEYYSEKSGAA